MREHGQYFTAEVGNDSIVVLRDRDNPSHSALGRFDVASKKLVPLRKLREGVWGIRPRNKEQHCALDLLLCDDIKLVTLIGKAGTGKTMLALATGMQKVVEEQIYSKLLAEKGTGRGVLSICAAGGQGVTAILERP